MEIFITDDAKNDFIKWQKSGNKKAMTKIICNRSLQRQIVYCTHLAAWNRRICGMKVW